MKPEPVDHHATELFCSFCGKSQKQIKKLIAGPSTYICNECVAVCNDIMGEEPTDAESRADDAEDVPIGRSIAERTLELREWETTRAVTVRIYKPEQMQPGVQAFSCAVAWDGLEVPPYAAFGADSAEALFNALDWVGQEAARRDLRIPSDDYPEGQKRNPWPIEKGPPSLPIAEPLPGDLILERWLCPPGSDKATARVTVHRPLPFGADDWECWYEIGVPGQPKRRRRNVGTDSAQALFSALIRIKWDIDSRGLALPNVDDPWEIKDPLGRSSDPEPE